MGSDVTSHSKTKMFSITSRETDQIANYMANPMLTYNWANGTVFRYDKK